MAIIVSASRREDIPSFCADWLFERLREGYVEVPNPFNPRQIRHVSLAPEEVACFVFWTRDATPMVRNLDALDPIPYYFHVTITGYGPPLEPYSLSLEDSIKALKTLAARIGKNRVIWRYDPVLIAGMYNSSWHIENFRNLAEKVVGSVRHCVMSFYDGYRGAEIRLRSAGFIPPQKRKDPDLRSEESNTLLARSLIDIAERIGLRVAFCAEPAISDEISQNQCACIDASLVESLSLKYFSHRKDKNQRADCRCIESVDIGTFGRCPRGCLYCYALRF